MSYMNSIATTTAPRFIICMSLVLRHVRSRVGTAQEIQGTYEGHQARVWQARVAPQCHGMRGGYQGLDPAKRRTQEDQEDQD